MKLHTDTGPECTHCRGQIYTYLVVTAEGFASRCHGCNGETWYSTTSRIMRAAHVEAERSQRAPASLKVTA